ncbi:hypothetical protein C8Q69DRAFT_505211 [Paecilomyces variotii]|uniref:3'-5' exonuclease domain-containing protein n=1 Tax=Byssochlamys spectabilis TaxID=264951 RepID=A0A443I3H1_BYSSP|nr:hypothetical protein C8Q69DRAFT_505211 [Paecilomyces variotii]RWQ98585.1 hypothetical protein C8Q69DRAFT_505211 [Paecilomyces variotii]
MFHSTPIPRIEISDETQEEYELEDFADNGSNSISGDLGAMIRNRQRARKPADLLSIRQQKMVETGQRSLPALLIAEQIVKLRREYRRLESMFSALTPVDELVSEYLSLKHVWLERQLATCASSIMDAELEHGRIRNARLQRLEDRLAALTHCISYYDGVMRTTERTLKLLQLESDISALVLSTSDLIEEVGEFLRPCISAREKINDILEKIKSLGDDYEDVRRIFRMAESNLIMIQLDLENIKNDRRYFTPAVREIFHHHYMALGTIISSTMATSHIFRSYHLSRKLSEGPLGRAWYPYLLRKYATEKNSRDTKSETRRDSIMALISPRKGPRKSPRTATVLPQTYAKILQRFYLSRLGKRRSSSNSLLNIYWRQLDVLAPFDLILRSTNIISKRLMDLARSLSAGNSDMWLNIRSDTRVMFREKTKRLFRRWTAHRFEFLAAYQSLVYINWLRLETENKLYALGDRTVGHGVLTPPRNLSHDTRAFLRWTYQVAADEAEIISLTLKDKRTTIFRIANDDPPMSHEQRQTYSEIMLDYGSESSESSFPSPYGRTATSMHPHKVTGLRLGPLLRKSRAKPVAKSREDSDRKADPKVATMSRKGQGYKRDGLKKIDATKTEKWRTSPRPPRYGDHGQPSAPRRRPSDWRLKRQQQKKHQYLDSGLRRVRQPVDFGKFSFSRRSYTSGSAITRVGATEIGRCDPNLVPGPNSSLAPVVSFDSEGCRQQNTATSGLKYFLDSPVVGFDIEWKAQASLSDSIQNNVSLIQLANEERIALFQIALFKPAKTLNDLVAPSLQKILESSDITKVGVSIRADSTRLRKFLGIDAHGLLELSHLYKLVKYSQSNPKMVNKRLVNLSLQVEEHLGLPLDKDDDVRRSDWTRPLDYSQVQYAATDPYACLCLFNVMEAKRKALDPVPPRPAFVELDLPIRFASGEAVSVDATPVEETAGPDPETSGFSHDDRPKERGL